jgi:proteasome lid subunit RPN8/RPN11
VLDFTASLFNTLAEKARATNEEICGFILRSGEIVELQNIAEDKIETWMIDPRHFLKYKKEIEAIYHSHPSGGEPSAEDRIGCTRINIPFLVVSLPSTLYYITPKEESCLQFDFTDI